MSLSLALAWAKATALFLRALGHSNASPLPAGNAPTSPQDVYHQWDLTM